MSALVVDASTLVNFLLAPTEHARAVLGGDSVLHAPAHCDVEVLHVLRKLVVSGPLREARAMLALAHFGLFPLARHLSGPVLPRIFALRHNFTAYDAAYVALAERLGAALVTADTKLADATRTHTRVPVIEA